MKNMTLAIPDALHAEMKQFPEIRWSEVARQALAQRVERFIEFEKIVAKSKLTKEDAEEIGDLIKAGMAKRLKEEYEKTYKKPLTRTN